MTTQRSPAATAAAYIAGIGLFVAQPALAQPPAVDTESRVNVMLGAGPRVVPRFLGDNEVTFGIFPQIEVWDASNPFPAEAPDEGISIEMIGREGGVQAGATVHFALQRQPEDVGLAVDKVGFGVEVGGFASLYPARNLRLRAELRQGIGGHQALTGDVRADLVVRTPGDGVVATIGPRLRWGSARYQRRYFGISPTEAARTGLPGYATSSGLYAVGLTGGAQVRLTPRWGVYGFATYDRLTGDAAQSPIVRSVGSRDQFSAGLALTYTFTVRR